MATEPSWNTKDNKEKMVELAFETWQTPAYYAVDKAVMSACVSCRNPRWLAILVTALRTHRTTPRATHRFAAGKGSALIVDIGDELTTVTPVYDGFVLRKGASAHRERVLVPFVVLS